MEATVGSILREDLRREGERRKAFDPVSGKGSPGGRRVKVAIGGLRPREQWWPAALAGTAFGRALRRAGSVEAFCRRVLKAEPTDALCREVELRVARLRMKHDFAYWAALAVKIKEKGGGKIRFILNRPQRRFVEMLEGERLSGRPIRVVMLKARQWGGSTCSQLYMAWLQLMHKKGLNSLIIAQEQKTSTMIKGMFDKMMEEYPGELLHEPGEVWNRAEAKMRGVGKSGLLFRVPARECDIAIGSYENPDSCRGGDYSLVHCSEVGLWKATESKTPEDIVGSACTGIRLEPLTMIVYESTAKGSDNFFHREYKAAKRGESQFRAFFVPWWEIDWNRLEPEDRLGLAGRLLEGRRNTEARNGREDSGAYLWGLWKKGATLAEINWYIEERRGKSSHDVMASECPSDDVEAFVYSGANVFEESAVERLRERDARPARRRGELCGAGETGASALRDVHFVEDAQAGCLEVWGEPEVDVETRIKDRYLVVVDVGRGRTAKADYSVICVIDRIDMAEGGRPMVVAQWRGRVDMDVLAWKAAQIAKWYDEALLVVESNSLESSGGAGVYVLSQVKEHYERLYARKASPEDIRQGVETKLGWHTNTLTKPMIILGLQRAVRDGLWRERSEACLEELLTYIQWPNGSYGAAAGRHDDMLMTRAIGLHVCFNEMGVPVEVPRRKGLGGKFFVGGPIVRREGGE